MISDPETTEIGRLAEGKELGRAVLASSPLWHSITPVPRRFRTEFDTAFCGRAPNDCNLAL
jgi:hypothetical protein